MGNKRRPLTTRVGEEGKRLKETPGCTPPGIKEGKGKEKMYICEELRKLQMEPGGEVLSIELFPGK